ncbi:MAG: CCA tRNA nucleotidyltransferase [Firmicutes bacterium]|nr:CCA tRNA nucleotidyltransferase [Bacillota bacterium]
MANLIPQINAVLSKELQALIYFLGYWSQKNRFKVYGMGGFVRDLILGRENRVIALLVKNSAVDFARSLGEIFPAGRLRYNEKLGTATMFLPQGIVFDMVTARKEFYSLTGAAAVTEGTALKNELYRKNFTINTMACAFNPLEFGWLYDFFGGRDDLESGLVRVLYRLSFVDDPCLMLQAIRFEQRFDFSMEKETKTLLYKARNSGLLKKISKERLYSEARLIFLEPSPLKVLMRLEELNLFRLLFPRLVLNEETKFRLQRFEQIFKDLQFDNSFGTDLDYIALFLAVLFNQLSDHDSRYLCYLLRLRRRERQKILFIRENLQPTLNSILEDYEEEEEGREEQLALINLWLKKYGSIQYQ